MASILCIAISQCTVLLYLSDSQLLYHGTVYSVHSTHNYWPWYQQSNTGGGGGEYNWGECDTTGTEFDEVTRLCAGLTAVPRSFIVYIGPSGVMCNSMELWQIEEGEETLRE